MRITVKNDRFFVYIQLIEMKAFDGRLSYMYIYTHTYIYTLRLMNSLRAVSVAAATTAAVECLPALSLCYLA